MFATQVLTETLPDDSEEENIAEIVGLIIVDDKNYELKKGETKIGRDSSMCSIVIDNFTVSKVHAVIESEGVDDSFIYDVGSTNQTRLGKKILKPHCRYKLDNNTILTLGNVTAKFVLPPDKNLVPDSQFIDPVNLDDLGDIFDLPTQVGISEPDAPSKAPQKLPENFQIFKIPNSVLPVSKSYIDESVQCRVNLQEAKQQTIYCTSPLDNSHIFSLETQCQIHESPSRQNTCDVQTVPSVDDKNKNSESDKIKSLLNDGQDDVLCTFMALHSPKEQSDLLKEINVKIEIESLSQVMVAPTQRQVETIQESVKENDRKQLKGLLENEDMVQELSTKNSCTATVTSTPVSSRVNLNHPSRVLIKNDNSMEHTDEDFIGTQEFNFKPSESNRERQNGSIPTQNEETQPYLVDSLNVNLQPASEPKNVDEDFIFSQTFEMIERDPQNEKTPVVIPETEDFVQTQIFTVENKMKDVFPKSHNRDSDSTLNFTQRNEEDDFIETQAFEEPTEVRNSDERSYRNDSGDDEDFIATQKIELPVKISNSKNCQAVPSTTAFSESSPDLLDCETFSKSFEDCISTQIFDSGREKPSTEVNKHISSRFEENECSIAQTKAPDSVESSGDETESDLEIILEKNETTGKERSQNFIKTEQCESIPPVISEGNNDSNSSYVFELQPENNSQGVVPHDIQQNQRSPANLSDSDATDCEEIAALSPKILVKEEPKEKVEFEETQVLTLTLPNDFAEKPFEPKDDWMAGAESPNFEIGSPLSLEMPNTQEIETAMNRILRGDKPAQEESGDFVRPSKIKKTEVGINPTTSRVEPKSLIDSPIKRPLDSNNADVIPLKKFKTETLDRLLRNSEKQLSKLVQAHDIAQIQPGRTRNSLKNLPIETKREVLSGNNISNERPTSRRKANPKKGRTKNQNGDITPYLTKKVEKKSSYGGRKKETSSNENQPVEVSTRVLRSSIRNANKSPNTNIRRSGRRSRTKDDEYFHSSCVNIVFTGFECQDLEKIISDLGGKKTSDLASGEVVVADKVRRTVKFLSAMGLGLPIASPQWLLSCKREKKFLNPWKFILKDEEAEERWDFELRASLEKSKKVKLLQGFSIFATKNTKPPVKDLLDIVKFCGGTPIFDYPEVWPKKTIIVSCLEDEKWWPVPKFRNVKIVHYEFILSGVLKQKIDFKTYTLR